MSKYPWIVIPMSFIIAMLLGLLPLPPWFENARPEWVALVLLFWVITMPYRINVGIAWILGLILDGFNGTLLGEHALALAVIAFVASKMNRRMKVLSQWQQMLSILLLILLYHMILFWVQGMIDQPAPLSWFWLSAISSAILWPWVYMLLRDCHRQFRTMNNFV
jgi:rod shape-determining protein MreD